MQRILALIDSKTQQLSSNQLFRWLANDTIGPRKRLSFAPSMLYYLMGFKDVLEAAHVPSPRLDTERMINAYCAEDYGHWKWYLRDLETLGFTLDTWGSSIARHCREIWSEDVSINRRIVFALVGYAKAARDPLLRLVEIQVLESTGLFFLENTRKVARDMDMDDKLLYFGRHHHEEELRHSVQPDKLREYELSEDSLSAAIDMVEDLWPMFDELFLCWYEHRDKYKPAHPIDSIHRLQS